MARLTLALLLLSIGYHGFSQSQESFKRIIHSELISLPCLVLNSQSYLFTKRKQMVDKDNISRDKEKRKECKGKIYPYIDFGKEVLFGFKNLVRSCNEPIMEYQLTKVDEELVLDLKFTTDGNCFSEILYTNWLIIPKEYVDKHDTFSVNEEFVNLPKQKE